MNMIYLDNCATTRCRSEVIDIMVPLLGEQFGNPSSPHVMGKLARRAVDQALDRIGRFIGADPADVTITSGATESNNLLMLGLFDVTDRTSGNALLCPIDHKSVLEVGKELARRGIEIRMAPVGSNGLVDVAALPELIDENTRLVSVCWVNSEIGTVQRVREIAKICHDSGAVFHVDAVQAAGRIPIDVHDIDVDALSLSAHKVYGPKGVGTLYVRSSVQHRVRPIIFGGGQARLRSGTLPSHLIAGFGLACELAQREFSANTIRATRLGQLVCDRIFAAVPDAKLNFDPAVSVPHIVNISFPGVTGESLVASLSNVAISTGSACNSETLQPSYVLKAVGLSDRDANSAVRICVDPAIDEEDLLRGLDVLCAKVSDLRQGV